MGKVNYYRRSSTEPKPYDTTEVCHHLPGNSQRADYVYSNSRNGATPFFAIITQRDYKYATPPPWKQFYVFLATASTGVLTAGGKNTLYGIDNTEISETVLKYQISDFP